MHTPTPVESSKTPTFTNKRSGVLQEKRSNPRIYVTFHSFFQYFSLGLSPNAHNFDAAAPPRPILATSAGSTRSMMVAFAVPPPSQIDTNP